MDRASDKIGARGAGARVSFGGPSTDAAARAPVGGSSIIIHDSFFMNPGYQGFIVAHEAGHLAGLRDKSIPSNAPFGVGINGKAYGDNATNWLGANQPNSARTNNDSHICLVIQCYP